MNSSALWWLFFNFLSIVILAFFSMMEMACVSFNRVRLQYYVSKGNKRAIWLNYLLHHPFRLFGTTLLGVNFAMVAGSECAREFHAAIGLSPDLAPITQVGLVVILGELAPMFAARHYAEHVAMIGVPIVYATARITAPLLWVVGLIVRFISFLLGNKKKKGDIFLSQEELQHILEEHGEEGATPTENFNKITSNIFQLRSKVASNIVAPLQDFARLPSNATVLQMRQMLKRTSAPFILIFYQDIKNIVGIAFPRDILRVSDSRRIRDHSRSPWFVTENTKIPQILNQFQRNNQSVAVIIDRQGNATGLITLDDMLEEIFGEVPITIETMKSGQVIDRTFPGEMLVKEFNQEFGVTLDKNEDQTLSELLEGMLEHHAEVGDSITIDSFELIAKEVSLMEIKSVTIRSIVS